MRTELVCLVFWFLLFAASSLQSDDCEASPEHAPEQIHLSLSNNELSMVVMWNTKAVTPTSTVRYFQGPCSLPEDQKMWQSAEGTYRTYPEYNGYIHIVKLHNLEEDSRYCYMVGDPCKGFSLEEEFKIPDPHKLVFAALADTGTWGNVTEVLANLATDVEPTVVLHAGDLSYAQTDSVWDTFGYLFEPVAKTRPYMVIPGNWDVKPFAVRAFLARFDMPLVAPSSETKLSYYYSFNYSVVHFVMMSSYDPFNSSSEQYRWLEEDLKNANEDRDAHPWIVICFHSPMYSSSVGHEGSDLRFRADVEPLLQKYKVDLALSGHDHGYERTFPVFGGLPTSKSLRHYDNPSATVHILAGTGGATSDEWMALPTWTAHRESTHGYTKVHASPSNLRVVYRRIDGSIGDEFWISKTSRRRPFLIVALIVAVAFVIFPYCAYMGYPNQIFRSIMGKNQHEQDL
jgi:hypothetical protein